MDAYQIRLLQMSTFEPELVKLLVSNSVRGREGLKAGREFSEDWDVQVSFKSSLEVLFVGPHWNFIMKIFSR